MNRVRKIVVVTTSLLGLTTGIVSGIRQGRVVSEAVNSLTAIVPSHLLSEFSAVQFHYADAAHAREAAMFEIHTMERVERLDPKSPQLGLGMAYARLAMIEESAGQPPAAQAAFAKARERWSKQRPPRQPTDDQMRQAVRNMDSATEKVRY